MGTDCKAGSSNAFPARVSQRECPAPTRDSFLGSLNLPGTWAPALRPVARSRARPRRAGTQNQLVARRSRWCTNFRIANRKPVPHRDTLSLFRWCLERTAIELRIRVIHSTIGRPQGRGKIERSVGSIYTEVLPTLPGHPGPGNRKPRSALDLPELDRAIGGFVVAYNDRPHSEIGVSPRDAWVAEGWLPRMPESLEDLDGLLLTVPKNRTVQRDGRRQALQVTCGIRSGRPGSGIGHRAWPGKRRIRRPRRRHWGCRIRRFGQRPGVGRKWVGFALRRISPSTKHCRGQQRSLCLENQLCP